MNKPHLPPQDRSSEERSKELRAQRRAQEDADFERARQLLERTVQFLSRCVEEPETALQSEDPRALIQGLKALSVEPASEPLEENEAPRTIQIRHRRSA